MLLQKHSPRKNQYIYMFRASDFQLLENAGLGFKDWIFSEKKRMGVNTVSNFFRSLSKDAGLANWEKKTPHSMRRFVLTMLANSGKVNMTEVARTARHNSVSSQMAYISKTKSSEVSRC